jgi:GxxExxY protein
MDAKHADAQWLNELSGKVIGAAFNVLNTLGAGYLEKVYENALAIELRENGFAVEQQYGMTVIYKGKVVGEYFADLLVNNTLLIELKVARALEDIHHQQCINYLKATGLRLCLLLNFAKPRPEIKRVVDGLQYQPLGRLTHRAFPWVVMVLWRWCPVQSPGPGIMSLISWGERISRRFGAWMRGPSHLAVLAGAVARPVFYHGERTRPLSTRNSSRWQCFRQIGYRSRGMVPPALRAKNSVCSVASFFLRVKKRRGATRTDRWVWRTNRTRVPLWRP